MSKKEEAQVTSMFATKEDLVAYLKANLKLEAKSAKIAPNESKYKYQIVLKLENQFVSGVEFVA